MDSFSFYKSIYERELSRRSQLDNSINTPITALTLIVGINSLYLDKIKINDLAVILKLQNVMLPLIGLTFLISLFFIIKFYNNLFKGFSYRNLARPTEIREYEIKKIPKYNSSELIDESEQINFENTLIERINNITDNHIIINDERSWNLYMAKTFIILTLLFSGIQLLNIALTSY